MPHTSLARLLLLPVFRQIPRQLPDGLQAALRTQSHIPAEGLVFAGSLGGSGELDVPESRSFFTGGALQGSLLGGNPGLIKPWSVFNSHQDSSILLGDTKWALLKGF